MPRRQPFDDFLNSAGPSTPRGGGRGGRGGRGGTPRSNGGQGSSHSFAADYSQVPFDYSRLNGKKYQKLDGFSVQPFGNASTNTEQPARSPYTPRGTTPRGGGRGRPNKFTTRTPQSGSATPVTGLGFHGEGHSFHKGKGVDRGSGGSRGGGIGSGRYRAGDTVGRKGVLWGGGNAPLFVKAGELFKDGEVDIITMDKDHHIHVEVESLSDPSAPQMNNLEDEVEVDIIDEDLAALLGTRTREPTPWSPEAAVKHLPAPEESNGKEEEDEDTFGITDEEEAQVIQLTTDFGEHGISSPNHLENLDSNSHPEREEVIANQHVEGSTSSDADHAAETPPVFIDTRPDQIYPSIAVTETLSLSLEGTSEAEDGGFDIRSEVSESHNDQELDSLFFVDTAPAPQSSSNLAPQYETSSSLPLGHHEVPDPKSDEENIIFQPRRYAQPKPIVLDVPTALPSAVESESSITVAPPHVISRREKKALKKEKRNRRKNKSQKKGGKRVGDVYEGSDLDWGSDGPPVNVFDVEGVDLDDQGDLDIEILKDYLAGTLLGAETDEEEEEEEEEGSEADEKAIKALGDGARDVGEGADFEIESEEEDNPWIATGSDEEEDSEDSDGSGSSNSDLGPEADILDSEDSEDEDGDEDDLFKGKDAWGDTEWLIAQMEEALDGDINMAERKARNATFRAIESGDFGDDWGIAPAPKKNKKSPFIPAELQGQWEKDRQRKAERRRQRDLERLLEAIDPYPATHGKKGKGKKAQGSSKIDQARMAHLIPESASRVAELFDIPSDGEDPLASLGRMGRMGNLLPGGRGLWTVDEGIKRFIADQGKTTYSVPPMDKEGRKKVHMLAECYGLTSKSRGKGKSRFTVLTKTKRTGLNVNEDKVSRLVAAAPFSGGLFYKALYTKSKSGASKDKGKKGPGDRGTSARMREGETVGEGADRIGVENIGHRLLSRMGWAEGNTIGKSDGGLDNPIMAIVKNTKMGLGA